MPDILIEPTAPAAEPAPSTPTMPGDDAPLSAHIDAFHRDTDEGEPTEPTQEPRKRHRAAKDRARPEDVPRIRELTGKVKDAETRAEQASREAKEWREKYESSSRPAPVAATHAPAADPVPEKFSYATYDEALAKSPDLSWEDYLGEKHLALSKWDLKREAQAQARQQATQQQDAATQAEVTRYQTARAGYEQRMLAYVQAHPEHRSAFEQVPNTAGAPLFNAALILSDTSAEMLYRLRQDPDAFDEAVLFAYGKPVDDANVARMQRWLQKRIGTGTTGAAPPAQSITPAPRPPTPVRTTPVPPTDEPPGDNASLRDHARAFHKKDR